MLTNSLRIKLVDFGLSRLFRTREERVGGSSPTSFRSSQRPGVSHDLDQTANCGTARFMAPEVCGMRRARDARGRETRPRDGRGRG